jgi:hypothetical protein
VRPSATKSEVGQAPLPLDPVEQTQAQVAWAGLREEERSWAREQAAEEGQRSVPQQQAERPQAFPREQVGLALALSAKEQDVAQLAEQRLPSSV